MHFRAAFAALCGLPMMLGLAWAGCATADEQVDAVPKKTSEAGTTDTGGGGDDSGSPTDTTPGSVCGETGLPNNCTAAVDLGSIALGGKKSASNALPIAGGEIWFKASFEKLEDLKAHPRIRLTATDPGLSVTVVRSCSGDTFSCNGGDASSSKQLRDFEIAYALTDPTADSGDGDATGPDPTNADAFIPISGFVPSPVYFKVTRSAATATGCDFTVDVSN